jgi:hypothetical protein
MEEECKMTALIDCKKFRKRVEKVVGITEDIHQDPCTNFFGDDFIDELNDIDEELDQQKQESEAKELKMDFSLNLDQRRPTIDIQTKNLKT